MVRGGDLVVLKRTDGNNKLKNRNKIKILIILKKGSEIKATAESIVDHKVKIFWHQNGNQLVKRVTFQELKVVKPSYYEKLKMRFSANNLKLIVYVSSLLLIFFILITEMINEYSLSKKAYEECILSKASWYNKFNFLSSKCIN